MKSSRPTFLNLFVFQFPITAIVSILHRITGVLLFVATGYLLWMVAQSTSTEEQFNSLKETLGHPLHSFVIWLVLTMVGYHLVAGVRHLLMDLHIGESLNAGRMSSVLVIVIALALSVASGLWIWL